MKRLLAITLLASFLAVGLACDAHGAGREAPHGAHHGAEGCRQPDLLDGGWSSRLPAEAASAFALTLMASPALASGFTSSEDPQPAPRPLLRRGLSIQRHLAHLQVLLI